MNELDLIKRIWLVLALSLPLTFYLVNQDSDWFLATTLLGSLAIFHAEFKARCPGWDHGIVLLAHFLALLMLGVSVCVTSIMVVNEVERFLIMDFNDGLVALVLAGLSFAPPMIANDRIENHYKKFRK
jgi:hypothetical protein